jgi:beta-mannanase
MTRRVTTVLLAPPFLLAGLLCAAGSAAHSTTGTTASIAAHSFGVSISGLPANLGPLSAFETMVGRNAEIANYYVDFTTPAFNASAATAISDRGTIPMITWQPMDSSLPDPVQQPQYSLSTIIDGSWDGLLMRWAKGIAAWGRPLILRFAHEMNGNWYPWSEGVNGNTSGQYVRAWRHVHKLFIANGATNVDWVWSPNADYPGSTPLSDLYPGDDYVNTVGVDGYNWGTSQSWSVWQTPQQVFHATVADARTLTHKPILLTEVASAGKGGDKAQWITSLFAWLEDNPNIEGFIWFDFKKEADWMVNSSAASEAAFISGLSTY